MSVLCPKSGSELEGVAGNVTTVPCPVCGQDVQVVGTNDPRMAHHRVPKDWEYPVRNRETSPSINWPQSREEAFRAVRMQAQRLLRGEGARDDLLSKPFTTDSGLGTTRTMEQAEWLEEARFHYRNVLLRALEDQP